MSKGRPPGSRRAAKGLRPPPSSTAPALVVCHTGACQAPTFHGSKGCHHPHHLKWAPPQDNRLDHTAAKKHKGLPRQKRTRGGMAHSVTHVGKGSTIPSVATKGKRRRAGAPTPIKHLPTKKARLEANTSYKGTKGTGHKLGPRGAKLGAQPGGAAAGGGGGGGGGAGGSGGASSGGYLLRRRVEGAVV